MSYWARVAGALPGRQRLTIAAALAFLASLQFFAQPIDYALWTAGELVQEWLVQLGEFMFIAGAMLAAYTLVDTALLQRRRRRWLPLALAVAAASCLSTWWVVAWRSFGTAPSLADAFLLSLRWTGMGCVVIAVHLLQQRAAWRRTEVLAAWRTTESLQAEEEQQKLQLLQAQIEPHFLFNTLANVRSLFRTDPESGRMLLDSLTRYLRAALPRMRNPAATLADEFELVQAYLDLSAIRMGPRLSYACKIDPGVREASFPPMLLLTLVENAVKHGIAPSAIGGRIQVSARGRGRSLEVEVVDDGVGLRHVPSGGTGVGLANVRRQLSARYGARANLTLVQNGRRGAKATLTLPWISAARVAEAAIGGVT